MVPPLFRPLMQFNPFAPLIVAWRTLFLEGIVDWSAVGIAALAGAVSVAVGVLIFQRVQWKLAEAL
jgi:lipopolysaccharide transport system permease protein